jgi:3-isopropylmalate/(R)-2-methylmalate dehydratase small subunit
MNKFNSHTGIAAPLLQANIDTDAIIPSREMKAVSKHGLAVGLFAGWRYLSPESRKLNPDFVLNQAAYANTSILLGGDNFGCGSSREHAVWALKEYGIRAIIAPGFGGIFFNNCVHNGILPVVLHADHIQHIASAVDSSPAKYTVTIDLETNSIGCGELDYRFELESNHRDMLMQGLDPIGLTLRHENTINTFEEADRQQRPWAYNN